MLWGGLPKRLLQAGRERRAELFTSPALLEELADILKRRKFAGKIQASGLSADELIERYAELAKPLRPVILPPTIKADPDDDQVLACAVTARADVIVSGDRHLLDLQRFEGIQIMTAAEAVGRLGL